jgi:hypothetical protein
MERFIARTCDSSILGTIYRRRIAEDWIQRRIFAY